MKKYLFLFLLSVIVFSSKTFANSPYKLNNFALNQTFEQSSDITNSVFYMNSEMPINQSNKLISDGTKEVSRKKAAWLACCCFGIGVHRAYMGQSKQLIVYYVLADLLLGAGWIISVIDAIHYFQATDSEFRDKYLNDEKFIQSSNGGNQDGE